MGNVITFDEFELRRYNRCMAYGRHYISHHERSNHEGLGLASIGHHGQKTLMSNFPRVDPRDSPTRAEILAAGAPCEALPGPWSPLGDKPHVSTSTRSFLDILRDMLIHWLANDKPDRPSKRKDPT